jgi:hypothetical protein
MDGEIMGRTRRRKSTCRVAFAERGVQGGVKSNRQNQIGSLEKSGKEKKNNGNNLRSHFFNSE